MLLTANSIQLLDLLDTPHARPHDEQMAGKRAMAEAAWRVLELQGLVEGDPPAGYYLSSSGKEVVRLLRRMREDGALLPTAELQPGWRFIGSEVLAALDAAARCDGRCGVLTEDLLAARGLLETPHDFGMEIRHLRLNAFGRAWLDLARRMCPRLEVSGALAAALLKLDLSGAGTRPEDVTPDQLAQLEAMELLVWSVPDAAMYALTTLGQAVYDTLQAGSFPTSSRVLDAEILRTLAQMTQQGLQTMSAAQIEAVQLLSYLDADRALTASGAAAMRVYALLRRPAPDHLVTFAIGTDEVEMLAALRTLTSTDARPVATKAALKGALVGHLEHQYLESVGRYGRELQDSRPDRKQALLATLEQLKEHDRSFATAQASANVLLHLESLDLVRPEGAGHTATYRLTARADEVLEDQLGGDHRAPRAITADAVKAITWNGQHHAAPATVWIKAARAEGLLGTGGITQSGHRYADLAQGGVRKLALTQREARALVTLSTLDGRMSRSLEPHMGQALERLEARGLIERQVDGQVVRTEAGQILVEAVAQATQLTHPVTPALVQLLEAVRQVGAVDERERHIRLFPDQWREVECRSGLSREAFANALHLARIGGYVVADTLNEAGWQVLEAAAKLNEHN